MSLVWPISLSSYSFLCEVHAGSILAPRCRRDHRGSAPFKGPISCTHTLHRLIRRTSSALQCVSDGALEREFRMTKKQNGNYVLWFPGPCSQLSIGNFLKACSLQCRVLVKDRIFAALFIHKLQFVPPFWCLNVDIWRSQSAIRCSSCIFNTGRDMRAGETLTSSFNPQNFLW